MAHLLRDRVFGSSRRHSQNANPIPIPIQPTMPVHTVEGLPNPFGELGPTLSDSELRETVYEILVGACRSSGPKPLTYVPQSEKTDRSALTSLPSSLQRSTSSAASRFKKALGMKSASGRRLGGGDSVSQGKSKWTGTVWELVRVQMKVSEQTDTRVRRALLRVAAGQLGRRIECMVLPLELLQQFKSSDFPTQQEYEAWQRRNLRVLEAGLLLYPYLPLDKRDTAPQQLRKIIHGALDKPIETGKHTESMQVLYNVVMSLANRSVDGSVSKTCHWADGFPFNLRLYQMLLESCFDPNEETSVIEELEEVFDLIKKTWVVLGINQMLHNLCFSWVLFHRYVTTGQVDNDLLLASSNLLAEVEQDAYGTKDPSYLKILSSTLSSILGWAEKRLLAYRDNFHSGNIEAMENILSLGLLSAKILFQDISHEHRRKRKETNVGYDKVDAYTRSSIRLAFAQKLEKVGSSKHYSKSQNNLPVLTALAQDVCELAFSEKEIFGPVLKRWHPLATGIAMATLHSCYGNELKQFVAGISDLTPDTIQVLRAADKLEKDLVQIAVEDLVDSEDGGMSIIREMPPYEAEAVIANLAKAWIRTRVDRLREWVDRNLHQEVWNPKANKERFAPSAVEVLRIIDDTLEAFFMLPIPMHSVLVPELMIGLDKCIQHYILKAKSGCGTGNTFIPTLPALTRCSAGSKYGVFKKKERLHISQRRKSQVGSTNGDSSFGIPQLCVRINTLQLIRMELGVFEKRIISHLGSSETPREDNIANGVGKMFELSTSACVEGIQQLCEATAYKVVFHDLSHVLFDGLYIVGVSSSRIEPFLQELEQYLEIISSTVHDRVRTRVITDVMRASFDGFLLVLLAGGPSRTFTRKDSDLIEEDFRFLTDLFWSNGDGLPADVIDKLSTTIKGILPLYGIDTDSLVEQFKRATLENYGSSAKSRLPMPPTTGEWTSNEPNTLLRVLCYRNDETAAKFLKKTYNLPKKL
ncbi:protein unc-13 homolog isoform X1 [Pyrus x bretschneideri]|uniref:protein unc-13 homolog isoform X1 n=1 Tax=Pyrus x bretschneideri TaxID=225117 RepID=UPI00202FA1EB|nr:protein unc-13 homolog isoform X1 [Pyrus x bretschneideri]